MRISYLEQSLKELEKRAESQDLAVTKIELEKLKIRVIDNYWQCNGVGTRNEVNEMYIELYSLLLYSINENCDPVNRGYGVEFVRHMIVDRL